MRFFKDTRGIRKRSNRPHGRLPSNNILDEMMENTIEYVALVSNNNDVLGITLAGGLSRGYADKLSEVDLNIYLASEACREWSMGKGPIPHGDHKGTKYHMDVSFLDYQKERESEWSLLKKWDSSYAKILYDPENMIQNLLDEKDIFTAHEKYRLALTNYLDCVYFSDIVVRQWTQREDPMVAHQMISMAIPSLTNLLFLANAEYPPFEKWLINYSHSLDWKPDDWEKRVREVSLIRELSLAEAQRRSSALMELYHEVWARIVGEEHRETGLLELDAFETLEYVIQNTPSVEDFTEIYGVDQLGYEVLFKLADIETRDGVEVVVFNWDEFHAEKEAGFPSFLDWNKKMLSHINQ